MRIPIRQVQVPVIGVLVPCNPFQGSVRDNVRRLVANIRGGADAFPEVAQKVPGPVPFGEGGDCCRQVAVCAQVLAQERAPFNQAVSGVCPETCRLTVVADHAVGDAELAACQGRP